VQSVISHVLGDVSHQCVGGWLDSLRSFMSLYVFFHFISYFPYGSALKLKLWSKVTLRKVRMTVSVLTIEMSLYTPSIPPLDPYFTPAKPPLDIEPNLKFKKIMSLTLSEVPMTMCMSNPWY
jgi:hypothetical protein